VYPESLAQIAADRDRSKIANWFQREGLGQGSAGNKAATLLLLSSPRPNDAPLRGGSVSREGGVKPASAVRQDVSSTGSARARKELSLKRNEEVHSRPGLLSSESFPLHVNVQIHISADAGTEQIESIFAAMRRYLYDAPNT
jgi:hypothetical protein